MNKMISAVVIIGLLGINPLFVCGEDAAIDKNAKPPESSTNPDNQSLPPRLERFYSSEDLIEEAYTNKEYELTKKLAKEYLELALVYRGDWNYGNAIHDANRFLGLISIHRGNIDEATVYLLKAGKSTGSPQLDTFGPKLDLANELLKLGKSKEVLIYLKDIRSFWEMDDGNIIKWIEDIESGGQPELDRFAFTESSWNLFFLLVLGLWPLIVTGIFLRLFRKKMKRTWLFAPVAIVVGYIGLFFVSWNLQSMFGKAFCAIDQLGGTTLLKLTDCSLSWGRYIFPVILIFVVSRFFIKKSA
jgi:hypothetical protein